MPHIKELEKLQELVNKGIPQPVEIIGTTFGNELQNKILNSMRILNLLMFYLCSLATLRWFIAGN